MASTVTNVIELLVGLACLGLGAAVWAHHRVLAVCVIAAGLAAAVHAGIDFV